MKRVPWTRDQLLLAFRLYCRTPFGRLHQNNPEILELAGIIGRTPSAVAMKACNFASLDPLQHQRKISALRNASHADKMLWEEFQANPDEIAAEAEATFVSLTADAVTSPFPAVEDSRSPDGPTEKLQTTRVRLVQRFFRAAVLSSYEFRCALSGIAISDLLIASHIVPWSVAISRRADPTNGIALNALYDRAFDRGMFAFDDSLRVILSDRLRRCDAVPTGTISFRDLEGRQLNLPSRFAPDLQAIAYHRKNVFVKS